MTLKKVNSLVIIFQFHILSQAVSFGVIDKLSENLREFNPESLLNETTD